MSTGRWAGPVAAALAAALSCSAVATEVRLAKAEQRLAGLRTMPVTALAAARQAPGRVVADPRHRWTIAAPEDGFVQPPPAGYPSPGARIRRGQVLAYLQPAIPSPERGSLAADHALAQRDVRDGRLKAERFNAVAEALDVSLPTPAIQILTEYRSAQSREHALGEALRGALTLVADREGVLLGTADTLDRRLQPRGVALFTVAAADRWAVEVQLAGPGSQARHYTEARRADGSSLPLAYLSERLDPVSQARQVLYAVDVPPAGQDGSHAIENGEPVLLQVPASSTLILPESILWTSGKGVAVWVHTGPEHFRLLAVDAQRSGDGSAQVQGLPPEARVVVAGAAALQARWAPQR